MPINRTEPADQPGGPIASSDPRVALLAQLHTAEYSALMARISSWAQLQYAAWPIILGALAILSQMKDVPGQYRWWLALIVTLLVYLAFQGNMVGMLFYVLLIERDVRPRVERLVGTDEFWVCERIWRKRLPANLAWAAWWPPLISAGCIVAVVWIVLHEYGLCAIDWRDGLALVTVLVLWCLILDLTRKGSALSAAISKVCADSGIEIPEIGRHLSRRARAEVAGSPGATPQPTKKPSQE